MVKAHFGHFEETLVLSIEDALNATIPVFAMRGTAESLGLTREQYQQVLEDNTDEGDDEEGDDEDDGGIVFGASDGQERRRFVTTDMLAEAMSGDEPAAERPVRRRRPEPSGELKLGEPVGKPAQE